MTERGGQTGGETDTSSAEQDVQGLCLDKGGFLIYDKYPILKYIQDNVIGWNLSLQEPYGPVRLIYCDYTASGRSLRFIEDFVKDSVCPFYGNTHTTTSICSQQTTRFRDEAREIIKSCVNASKDDVVIFTGSGCTAAIHKLIAGLDLEKPDTKAVVIMGPYEHHSNILPWKELGLKIERIKETEHGQVDLKDLEKQLKKWKKTDYQIIAAFSAASNVTGIITDTMAVTRLVHKYGGYSVWDYATAGAYLQIDMNPPDDALAYKDAVVLSPHKFVGGPGTPGILIAKKTMFRNPVPEHCGGGTVLFVTRDSHLYLKDIESREEGGTPAIIESIRAGLVFQLKQNVRTAVIEKREEDLNKKAFLTLKDNNRLIILGSHSSKRLSIFSFLVKNLESKKFLHHNFVSKLLNDLFGIQARGGCACAGPYAEDLLGISEDMAQRFTWFLLYNNRESESCPSLSLEIMKPGFIRLNLPYFYEDEIIDYILNAINFVASEGWKFLPDYSFDPYTGSWTHRKYKTSKDENFSSLHYINYNKYGRMVNMNACKSSPPQCNSLKTIIKEAHSNMDRIQQQIKVEDLDLVSSKESQKGFPTYGMARVAHRHLPWPAGWQQNAAEISRDEEEEDIDKLIPKDKRNLRWFLTPREAINILKQDPKYSNQHCQYPLLLRAQSCRNYE